MAVRIIAEACINCGWCRRVCPTETIRYFSTGRRLHRVEPAGCIDCDRCVAVCPEHCIVPDPEYVHDPSELEAAEAKARAWAARQRARREALRRRAAQVLALTAAPHARGEVSHA